MYGICRTKIKLTTCGMYHEVSDTHGLSARTDPMRGMPHVYNGADPRGELHESQRRILLSITLPIS